MKNRTLAVLAGLTALVCQLASAQDFPSKPVKLLVGYAPGGSPDTIGRAVAPYVSAALGQSFVVENRPGAGGMTAALEVMRAAPDGYTLLSGDSGQWGILPVLRPGIYDFEKAFAPVGQVSTNALYIVVRSSLPVKNIQEFIALAKSKPGGLNYASSGNGTVHHLFMESFKAAAGIDLVHVPFKGSGQMVQALLSGDVSIGVAGNSSTGPHVNAGKLKLLIHTTRERSRLTPDVPAMGDIGLDLNFAGDISYFAPAGTPRPVIDKLSAALAKAVQHPEVQQRAGTLQVEPTYRNPEQLAELVRADVVRYAKAVKLANVKLD